MLSFALEIREENEGNRVFPSSFEDNMSTETQIDTIEKLLQPLLTDDIFLVEIKVKPTHNFKIYLDADGGLGIEKCIRINRALYKAMEEKGMYPDGDFSLEVSSPGLTEPLKLYRQYVKNVGRDVEVTLKDETKKAGTLLAVQENELTLQQKEGKGKKETITEVLIPFSEIKATVIQIKF